jgi:hypothetical protein
VNQSGGGGDGDFEEKEERHFATIYVRMSEREEEYV